MLATVPARRPWCRSGRSRLRGMSRAVLLDVASFLDSVPADGLGGASRDDVRAIATAFVACCYEDLGKAPRLLDGEDVRVLLAGLLPGLPADTALVLASDHGNIEDVRKGHTLNPVLALVAGPGAGDLAPELTGRLSSITDLPELILGALGLPSKAA